MQSPFPCLDHEIQSLAETGPSLLLQQWTVQGFHSEGLKGLDPWLWLSHLGQSLTPTRHQPLAAPIYSTSGQSHLAMIYSTTHLAIDSFDARHLLPPRGFELLQDSREHTCATGFLHISCQ